MSAKRTMYNEDKANAVFAVKIRKLFEENGKTHNSLAEFIEQRTGESVTRQAVGQWCNGNTCPNLRIVPIIAEFFGVSTDYLLTDTEIKTADIERKAVCEYTGLSEEAIANILEEGDDILLKFFIHVINHILEHPVECAAICAYISIDLMRNNDKRSDNFNIFHYIDNSELNEKEKELLLKAAYESIRNGACTAMDDLREKFRGS